jgi:hypothetical protein
LSNSLHRSLVDLVNTLTTYTKVIGNLLKGFTISPKGQDALVPDYADNVSPHINILHESCPFVKSKG